MNRMIFSTDRYGLLFAPFISLFLLLTISFTVQAAIVPAGISSQATQPSSFRLISAQDVKPDGMYLVYVQKGDVWREVAALPFDKFFRERKINLGEFVPLNGPARVRLVQKRGGAAHIDTLHLGGLPPVEVKGTGDALALKKLTKKDFDVLDAYGKTLDFLFPAKGSDRTLTLVARIEGLRITETPFHYPTRNLYQTMTPKSAFYTYHLVDTKIAAPLVGGRLKASNEPFFKEWSDTGTGHPSGFTYGWVANDDKNLYVKLDFTPDDTMDGDKDYSKVYVKTEAGLKEFKITSNETKWGAVDFTYTDKVEYQHKVYDFKIPLQEIGLTSVTKAKNIQLAFAAYGTAGPSASAIEAVNPVTNKIYLANNTSSIVTVVDGATGATTTVTAGNSPAAIAVNPTTNKIYVANYGDGVAPGTVTVIDGATNTASAIPITVGVGPIAIAVNPVTNTVYVVNSLGGTVKVIDGGNNVITTLTVGANPQAVAVNPVTNRIYVANSGSSSVSVINGATHAAGDIVTVATGSGPAAIAVNPVTNRIYVANSGANNVSVINGATHAAGDTVTVATDSGSAAIAVNTVTNKVYVAKLTGNVTVIDGNNGNAAATVTIVGLPQSVAINATTNRIYIPTNGGDVAVIDGASDTVVKTVPTGTSLRTVAVNPVTNKAYVSNYDGNNAIVIDGATNAASNLTTGFSPYSVAFNPTTNMVYVANSGSDSVTIINAMTGAVFTNRPVGSYPQGVAVNPAKNRVYVANYNSDTVSVINSLTNIVTDTISLPAGSGPQAITVNPATGKVYTANWGTNNVSVIDTNNANTVSTVPVPIPVNARPYAIAVNPATNTVYAVNKNGNSVTIIDGSTDNVINTVNVGTTPLDIAVNPNTNKIYVANSASSYVTEINGADNTTTTSIPVGHNSRAIAVNPVTNRIYAAKLAGNIVTVINGSDYSTTPVTVGTDPYAVAVNPVSNKIYTVNYGSDNVTVIDGITNATVNVATGTQPQSLAINPLSNKVYTANYGSADGTNGVTIIEEQATQYIPLTVSIASFANNESALSTPTFSFTAASTFAPVAPSVKKIYYQYDTWQGPWKESTTFAANAGTVSDYNPLSIGNHVLYMFATDGQEATSTNTGFQSSPLIGSIAAYNFGTTGTPLSVNSGTSLTFDGVDDFVSVPNSSYTFTKGGFTVEAWVNPASLAAGADYKAMVSSPGDWQFFLNSSNPAYWGLSVCVPGCNAAESPANALLTTNQWQHVAGTFDGRTIRIYLNSILVASQAHVGTTYISGDIVIGQWVESFNGKIREVRIWDGAHDAAGIQATKDIVLTGSETGLIGYWRLNEGSGATVADLSSRNKPGYLGGVAPDPAAMPGWGAPQTLTVGKSGDGIGTVTSTPAGISCGATCSASFGGGIVVALTASPGSGSVFAGWNGGGCSGTGTCTVTMDAAKSVTAYFDPQITYTLTTAVSGTGGASGTVSPASGTFNDGSYQYLSAIPDSVSVFDHWSGDCSGTNSYYEFTITGNMSCTANFAPLPQPLVTSTSPTAGEMIEDITTADSIAAYFNVAMNPSTINATTFVVKDQGGNPVTGTVTYDSYFYQATFTPSSFLPVGGTYTATLTTGVQNSIGAPMAADKVWSFTINPHLGGVPNEGNLLVTPLNDGRIGVYRYVSGVWQNQMYNWSNKGSRLQVNGTGYPLGYFGNGTAPALVANTQLGVGKTKTEWTTPDGLRIIQELTYQPGALYYGLTWKIANESASGMTALRFFHGEDTYFNGSDSGAGFWDAPNTTIGVQRTIGAEQRRMSLQAITTPFAYDSEGYNTIRSNVNSGALTNTIDPSEYTDNGYALEWRNATLAAGTTWTIVAFEKFADVAVGGGLFVQAPVTATCTAGTPCSLSFNIINAGGVSQTVNLAVSTDQTGWTGGLASNSITIPAGVTQQVIVTLATPATATAGTGHVTLTANSTMGDTAAVKLAVAPPPSTPLVITTTTFPNGSYGASYNQLLVAGNGTGPYTWSVASGTLPPGLSLTGETISGTPTQAGSYTFTLQVKDSAASPATASMEFSVTIDKVVLTVTATSFTKPPGYANPDFTASYSGFVNDDKISVLSGSPAFTTTATTESPVGSYDITIGQGTLTSPNYDFTFVNGILSVSEMVAGPDGKTTVPIALTASPGSQVTIAAGTLLTDAAGKPVTGPFTMASTPMGSIAALPQEASAGHSSGGTSLVALAASIDLNLSAGGVKITNIDPPMVVSLALSPTFATPGTTVDYYSFDGTNWQWEGSAAVKPDGTADMIVKHLSIWAVAKFEKLPSGKIALNGTAADPVTVADALRALQIAVGIIQPSANDLAEGDVAPLVNGRPSPNKQINVGDAIVILQKSLGVVKW